jgi:hypothetical protein
MNKKETTEEQLMTRIKETFKDLTLRDFDDPDFPVEQQQEFPTTENVKQLFRDLLLILSTRINQQSFKNLSYLLCRKNGLKALLSSTLEFDESSEEKTTLDMRFQSMSRLIVFLPSIHCSLEDYFSSIGRQSVELMLINDCSQYTQGLLVKMSSFILSDFLRKNKKLTLQVILDPIMESLDGKRNDYSVQESLQAIHSLIQCHFDVKYFIRVFHHIFYARSCLESSTSRWKSKIHDTLKEFLNQVHHSVILFDDALFNHFHEFGSTIDSTGDVIVIAGEDVNRINNDNITSYAVALASELKEEDLVDFVMILVERLNSLKTYSWDKSLLLCSILSLLVSKIEPVITKYPGKWVRFVLDFLERTSGCDEDIKSDSHSICLSILKLIVENKGSLDKDDVIQLITFFNSLDDSILESNETLSELKSQFDKDRALPPSSSATPSMPSSYSQAIKDLNDNLMPTRAHALITLKRLIESRDPTVIKNKNRVLELLSILLSDPESYVYLNAINTLGSLAVLDTETVLPLLLESFSNRNRSTQERLNVSEVLFRLFRRKTCIKFRDQVISCFYDNLSSSEDVIKMACLSNIGSFCSSSLMSSKVLLSLVQEIESLVTTDPSLEVRRAGLLCLSLVVEGIDDSSMISCKESLIKIRNICTRVYSNSLDEVSRLHAQLTLERLQQNTRELLSPKRSMIEEIVLK